MMEAVGLKNYPNFIEYSHTSNKRRILNYYLNDDGYYSEYMERGGAEY